MSASATSASSHSTAGGFLSGAFNFASKILHNPLGMTGVAFGAFSLINKPTGAVDHITNAALAFGITIAINAMFPHFLATTGIKSAVGNKALGTLDGGTGGPLHHILDPISKYESGHRLGAVNGGADLPLGTTFGAIKDRPEAMGRWQFIRSTRKYLSKVLGFTDATPFVDNNVQMQMASEMMNEAGVMNPAIPAKTVASKIADMFCVVAKPNGLPAPACGNSGGWISHLDMLGNVLRTRSELGILAPSF